MDELLTPDQMGRCDALAIAAGTPGTTLMARAGAALFEAVKTHVEPGGKVLVACGPGNNGGDGYVLAKFLAAAGYHSTVLALGNPANLTGDAAWAHETWGGLAITPSMLDPGTYRQQDLLVDALFGAGLSRGLEGEAAQLVGYFNDADRPVLSVDLPSGLDGRTGQPLGPSIHATQTVTFHRRKPGHVLLPGRNLCGEVLVADIGIDSAACADVGFAARLTGPGLTKPLQTPAPLDSHKYDRGAALIMAGPLETAGAGLLAAQAALRTGAGLVTLGGSRTLHEASLGVSPALMRALVETPANLARVLANPKLSVCALGPGLAPDEATRQLVYAVLQSSASVVLDAGALTAFAGMRDMMLDAIHGRKAPTILTPHAGEFARLFGPMDPDVSKIEAAQRAAGLSGAVIVLKGADTVIAPPDGDTTGAFVNANAPPWLATAGSGDVLCGIIAGLVARYGGSAKPSALCALGVWLHGAAAQAAGPALIASDLEGALHDVLDDLLPADFLPLNAP
ncbi:MAG: NAD(P)H-hydrate dehydratase [Pseudomonadota bacterium]